MSDQVSIHKNQQEVYIGNFLEYDVDDQGHKTPRHVMIFHHGECRFTLEEAIEIARTRWPNLPIRTDSDQGNDGA